jgi:hypothetical protein
LGLIVFEIASILSYHATTTYNRGWTPSNTSSTADYGISLPPKQYWLSFGASPTSSAECMALAIRSVSGDAVRGWGNRGIIDKVKWQS